MENSKANTFDINPSIQNETEYVLDLKQNGPTSIVTTKWVGNIYAKVTDGENNWTVMKDRLSPIQNIHENAKKD